MPQRYLTSRRIKLVLAIAALSLLVFLNPKGLFSPAKIFLWTITQPLQKTFYLIGGKAENSYDFFKSISDLKSDNTMLQKENNALVAELAQLKEEKKENETLREQFGLLPRQEYELEAGFVIGQDPQKLGSWLMIDKGSANGIFPEMPVIVSNGILLGKVEEVFPYSSKVSLLTASSNSINALDLETSSKGIVRGEYGLGIILDLVSQTDVINVGDMIVTSGLGSSIPKGLYIGKIQEVRSSEDKLFQQALIIPRVKYSKLDVVFVIKNSLRHDKI